jgi:hypothetical protein
MLLLFLLCLFLNNANGQYPDLLTKVSFLWQNDLTNHFDNTIRQFPNDEYRFWQDAPLNKNKYSWREGTDICNQLSIGYLDNFKMPTLEEIKILSNNRNAFEYSTGSDIWTSSPCINYKSLSRMSMSDGGCESKVTKAYIRVLRPFQAT